MKAFRPRLVSVVVWLGGLAVAFFAGTQFGGDDGGGKNVASAESPAQIAKRPGGDPSGSGTSSSPSGGEGALAKGKQGERQNVSVPALIAKARSQLGTGSGMMYHSSTAMRAMAPMAQLSEAQAWEAIAEVEATITNPQQQSMFYSILLGQLAGTNGAAAMAFAEENLSGQQGNYAGGVTASIISAWAQEEPEAAWEWDLGNREEESGESGKSKGYGQVTALFSALVSKDVDSAFARLEQLSDVERTQAASGIARGAWDPGFRDQILAHGESLPDDSRSTLYRGISYQWSMTDPEGAIAWMESLPADERKPLVRQAGSMLMASDPHRGADLMIENASEQELPYTYTRVVSQWAGRDPNAAGEWLNRQPQGPELDQARSSFARSVSWRDPYSAMEWAKTVENDDQRVQAVRQVYAQWNRKDPQSANTALDDSGLSADQIAGVRENAATQPAVKMQGGGGSAIQIFR